MNTVPADDEVMHSFCHKSLWKPNSQLFILSDPHGIMHYRPRPGFISSIGVLQRNGSHW
jgi:hypothetical protein